ncbi:MAG: hypothetical protein HZA22_08630 [Nitrospirae bacterium]|nr:hypothetical protein [Nitrospirota bacterium]MBI5695277.1 hypothetical protein [Nitrospirota bacterium]
MEIKRRNYLINRKYQGRFIGLYMAVYILGMAAAAATMVYYVYSGLESRLYRTHLDISSTGDVMLPVALQVNLAFFILSVCMIGYLSMRYSRKADRMARDMASGMRKLRDGHLDFRMELGNEDEFPGLERTMNEMIEANRARLADVARAVAKAEAAARELERADGADMEALGAAARRMRLRTAALRKSLKAFTLERAEG